MVPQKITVETTINASIEKAWDCFTQPEHITKWNFASDDWHSPKATNDLRVGGKFEYTMAAKDGSMSFDFWGIYDVINLNERIAYTLGDGRKAELIFTSKGGSTKIVETFEAETENTIELQKSGWQAILDNFKKHTESV